MVTCRLIPSRKDLCLTPPLVRHYSLGYLIPIQWLEQLRKFNGPGLVCLDEVLIDSGVAAPVRRADDP